MHLSDAEVHSDVSYGGMEGAIGKFLILLQETVYAVIFSLKIE